MRVRIVLLLGLPGAGKSTVGPLVAEGLGVRFVDLDRMIERAAGCTVPELFAREGEAGFRARERDATRDLAMDADRGLVIAPGGGWVEDPSNRAALGEGVLTVYLRVSTAVAMARIGSSGEPRPLLEGPNPLKKLDELLGRREHLYLQSNQTLSVDSMSPSEVATSIVALASGSGGD